MTCDVKKKKEKKKKKKNDPDPDPDPDPGPGPGSGPDPAFYWHPDYSVFLLIKFHSGFFFISSSSSFFVFYFGFLDKLDETILTLRGRTSLEDLVECRFGQE